MALAGRRSGRVLRGAELRLPENRYPARDDRHVKSLEKNVAVFARAFAGA